MQVRDFVGRNMLFPALRVFRTQMQLISDPLKLRAAAARVDALGAQAGDVRTEPVSADTVPATWVNVKGVRQDRVVLYLHGGAFITETPVFHAALLSRICREARSRGLMVSYRLAPEHPYPAALDDCVTAYRWLLAQGQQPGRIIVAGDSAGGNLTLALMLRLRDEGLPLPAGAVALSPVADLTFSGESVRRNDGVDDMFSADLLDALVPVYLGKRDLCEHPHVSPLFGDFAGMPPLLLIVGSTELLLDDSVRLAQRWPGATLLVWDGMPHVFAGFDFLLEAKAATRRIGRFIRECFSAQAASASAVQEEAEAVPAVDPASAHGVQTGPHRRLNLRALLYLAIAVVSAMAWLAVILVGVGPWLLLVPALVWAAAIGLGAIWAVAVMLFLRASFGARPHAREPEP